MTVRWVLAGTLLGAVLGLSAFAPASWLAATVQDASDGRLLLADARGTVWHGSAVLVLTAGPASRSASALPGRLDWRLGLDGAGLLLRARQACCIPNEMRLRLVPGWDRMRLEVPAAQGVLGQWPAAWLVGLGTPWNTLEPSGTLRLSSPGLSLEQVQGRWRFSGEVDLDLDEMSSRVSTLDVLGSYRVVVRGDAERGDAASLTLDTARGALLLTGSGQWTASKLRFTGQATAAPGFEAVLSNLLNIIGRRQGALSIISIG